MFVHVVMHVFIACRRDFLLHRCTGYERGLWSELEDALMGTQVAVSDRTGKQLNTAMTTPAAPTRETCLDTTSLPTVDIQV